LKTGIILQARTGSTRLPGKMTMDFFHGKTILDILLERLKRDFPELTIVVATTTQERDQAMVDAAVRNGVHSFRGSEDDVLQRFVDAANHYGLSHVVRICADNPMLSSSLLKDLLQAWGDGTTDYCSYQLPDGTPTIRSHYGLFAECVKTDALKKVIALNAEPFFHEHVTNYLYNHPESFNLQYLPAPEILSHYPQIRLTIDTAGDFINAGKVYRDFIEGNFEFTAENTVKVLQKKEGLLLAMNKEIIANSK
jgi:spore coat polysaccharide biosynthesis protein SpsF